MMVQTEMYDAYIAEALESGFSIDQIKLFGQSDEESAQDELERLQEDEFWDESLTLECWSLYVDDFRKQNPIPIEIGSATLGPIKIEEDLSTLLSGQSSSWRALKANLLKAGFSQKSMREIESSGKSVLYRLSHDTRDSGTVKGLVYGSVQSGKTVNMEALVSMAADTYWNIFIILSGTIENLRVQTRDRFKGDLQNTSGISWKHIDLAGDESAMASSQLKLNSFGDHTYGTRYVIACLKQKGRLTKLINWLYGDKDRARRMRVLVIDDEADQASVNTATILDGEDAEEFEQSRKEINRLIVCLANGLLSDGSKPDVKMQAINYISYTATPYANVLNEPPGESLYPKDFIHSLTAPDEYFGANVIFGNPEYLDENGHCLSPGIDVVRIIPESDVLDLKDAHDCGGGTSPLEMQRALCWFLCAAASLRVRGHKKPISMLVHTSNRGIHHKVDYNMVRDFLVKSDADELIRRCEGVYEEETRRFTYDDFSRDFSGYGLLSTMPSTYVEYKLLEPEIRKLLADVGNIEIAGDGEPSYSTGINICIDNCYADKDAPENTKMRVLYPCKESLKNMKQAPVFIVIGGNTLARGLTIEGLTCTYFTRNSGQADTLMQMARWFGYRRGFELLQRIWLTEEVRAKFRALTKVEMNLKEEIKRFEVDQIRPDQLGIKVLAMPEVKKFALSSKKKMQMADSCSYDFTGYTYEITEFDNDSAQLKKNIVATGGFLTLLSERIEPVEMNGAVVWRGVTNDVVLTYLSDFSISSHSGITRKDVNIFCDWLRGVEEERIEYWNVAVVGKASSPSGLWSCEGASSLPRVERTKLKRIQDWIDVGSMRSGSDALCDIEFDTLSPEDKRVLMEGGKNKDAVGKRAKLGLAKIPLLLIYRIDSASTKCSQTREPVGTDDDIISFSVIVPGDKHSGGSVSAYWIDMAR